MFCATFFSLWVYKVRGLTSKQIYYTDELQFRSNDHFLLPRKYHIFPVSTVSLQIGPFVSSNLFDINRVRIRKTGA